ncbi:MAG: hypothetical protein HZB83_00540 [Deltaproteobacteria bacterium]|nr:hypothetical protein [Deltaproteobacteria bacterium]
MIILAFDTSTSSGSAALMSGGETLAETAVEDAVTHADWLMEAVDGLFKASMLRINDVGLIALSIGPQYALCSMRGRGWSMRGCTPLRATG